MSIRMMLAVSLILLLSNCRIITEKELAELKEPPNPHLENAGELFNQKIAPQIKASAQPLDQLMQNIHSLNDFSQACHQLGYRHQPENACQFYTYVTGKIIEINTATRSGKITLKPTSGGDDVLVQIGPIFRGTALRDSYRDLSYSDFNDQTLFGDFGKAINNAAIQYVQQYNFKVGDEITVYGVFNSWDMPQPPLLLTPARIEP